MKLNTLLLLAALNWVFFGLGALITPAYVIPDNSGNELALILVRHMGSGAVVLGLLAWFTRALPDTDARRLIISIIFLAFALDGLINVMGIIGGVLPSSDWIFASIDILFSLGFGYFRFIKPE